MEEMVIFVSQISSEVWEDGIHESQLEQIEESRKVGHKSSPEEILKCMCRG